MSDPIDVVTFGEAMVLIQPQVPGPLAEAKTLIRSIAGAESNVAIALSRLGKRARWISRVGDDPFGEVVIQIMQREGVDISLVSRDPSAPTGIFFRDFRSGAEPVGYYYRKQSAASKLSPADIRPDWFAEAKHLHVSGVTPPLGEQTTDAVIAAMKLARQMGLTISYDPNLRRKLWDDATARRTLLSLVPLCDVMLPGREEAEFLLGAGGEEELAHKLISLGAKAIVMKLGPAGSMAVVGREIVRAEGIRVERVIDPIGAGDAFAAGFLSVFVEQGIGMTPGGWKSALDRANQMGSAATQFQGDWEGLPRLDDL